MAKEEKLIKEIKKDPKINKNFTKDLERIKLKRLIDKPTKTGSLKDRIDFLYKYLRLE